MIETYSPSPELESLQKLSESMETSKTPWSLEFLIFELTENCPTSKDFFYILESFPTLSPFAKEYIIKSSSISFTLHETLELLYKSDFQKIEDNDVNEHYPYEEALIQKTQNFEITQIPINFLLTSKIPFHIKKCFFGKLIPFDINILLDFSCRHVIWHAVWEILMTKVKKISLEEADTIIQRSNLWHIQKYYLYKALSPLQVTPELIQSLKEREQRWDDGEHTFHICEACEMFELTETNTYYFETGKVEFGRIEVLAKKVKPIAWWDFAKQILSNTKIWINIRNIFLQNIICTNFWEFIECIKYIQKIKSIQIWYFIENHPKISWDSDTEIFFQDIERDEDGDIEIFHRYLSQIVQKIIIPQEYYGNALAVLKGIKNTQLQHIFANCFTFQPPFSLLESIPEVSTDERKRNISRLNAKQRKYFTQENIWILPPKRTLVFYYRKWQWDYSPHYKIFIELLQKYIASWKSKIWNDFRVVLRHHPQYSHDGKIPFEIENISFFEKEGFRTSTSMYADTLSLNHGTFENIPGTFHIGWIAAARDYYKVATLNQETSPLIWEIPLNYYSYLLWMQQYAKALDQSELQLWFPLETDIETLCKILLEWIKKVEDAILQHIEEPRERVWSILEG